MIPNQTIPMPGSDAAIAIMTRVASGTGFLLASRLESADCNGPISGGGSQKKSTSYASGNPPCRTSVLGGDQLPAVLR
jgi:hypothetical protein